MKVVVYTKHGRVLHEFKNVDEVREHDHFYELVMEDDRPWCRVYGRENVILIKY